MVKKDLEIEITVHSNKGKRNEFYTKVDRDAKVITVYETIKANWPYPIKEHEDYIHLFYHGVELIMKIPIEEYFVDNGDVMGIDAIVMKVSKYGNSAYISTEDEMKGIKKMKHVGNK